MKPAEISSPPKTRPIYKTPDRASSPEIIATSPYAPPLVARLERQLMRAIWAAVDRPNPTNCRRTVAKRAPHQTASLTGYLKRAPIGPKSLTFCYFEWNYRCLEGGVLPTTHRSMTNRPWCRLNNRIGPRCALKCPSFEPSLRRFEHLFSTIFQYLNLF